MTVKAVFFDIDGTLLTDKRTVAASTIQAINQLKKEGYLVGLATGRGPKFSLPYMAALQMDLAICYNGQYIVAREGLLAERALAREDLERLIDYSSAKKYDLSFGTANDVVGSNLLHVGFGMARSLYWLAQKMPHFLVTFLIIGFNHIYRRLRPRSKASMLAELEQPVYQVVMLAGKRETDRMAERFPDLTFTRSSPYMADIISKGTSKLQGIALAGQHYGFDLSQVMVFGDSDNDLEMLSGAGYGVAMGNASRKVKQISRYVTASNNKSGIAKALSHFGLIEEGKAW